MICILCLLDILTMEKISVFKTSFRGHPRSSVIIQFNTMTSYYHTRVRRVNALDCVCLCLSGLYSCKPLSRNFVFGRQMHLQQI